MAPPIWALGKYSQLYVKNSSSYAVAPALAATDAVRHTAFLPKYNPQNLRPSKARHNHPSLLAMYRQRAVASWDLSIDMYPSGTLNTLPECATLLGNIFGQAPTNITLATTVASGASTTGATVASATGLAVGQPVQIGVLGGSAPGVYVRWLASVAGAVLTWTPALPATCAVSDTVKGCTGWTSASNLTPTDMDIVHYPLAPGDWYIREVLGCVASKWIFKFNNNLGPTLQVSGAAALFAAAPQSQPGAFTTVGAENAIPIGLYGSFQYGSTVYEIEELEVDGDEMHDVHNTGFGTAAANAAYRKGNRSVKLKIKAKVSKDLTLWTPSIAPGPAAPTENTMMIQIGTTSTLIWAMYFPRVIFDQTPDVADADETNDWNFSCTALGNAGNDECKLAMA